MRRYIIFAVITLVSATTEFAAKAETIDSLIKRVITEKLPNGTVYKLTVTDGSYAFDSAVYHVFIPKDMKAAEGVFIHQHGCRMQGRGASTAYDIQYQAFAKSNKLAIVAPDLYTNCADWRNPESGSGDALFKMLETIGAASGCNELDTAPWLLWGHSGGGYWSLSMIREYPKRIMAAFLYSPAFDPQWDYPSEVSKIPIMIRHAGSTDLNTGNAKCWDTAKNTFSKLRQADGYISIAYTPGQSHNLSYVRYMAIPFFESVLRQKGSDMYNSRLGDTLTLRIYKNDEATNNKSSMAWLPDEYVAQKWVEYVKTGTVIDKTPPPAPYKLELDIYDDSSIVLRWAADADIESGIECFKVYVNEKESGRIPKRDSFQKFNTNGDDAAPIKPGKMEYHIRGLKTGRATQISVTTINGFGLESPKTTIIYN